MLILCILTTCKRKHPTWVCEFDVFYWIYSIRKTKNNLHTYVFCNSFLIENLHGYESSERSICTQLNPTGRRRYKNKK